jgi:hypothetical protein
MWTHSNDKSNHSVADGEAVIGARSKPVDGSLRRPRLARRAVAALPVGRLFLLIGR